MLETIDSTSLLTVSVLIFVAVLLLFEGLYLVWRSYKDPHAKKMEKRLKSLSAPYEAAQQATLIKQDQASNTPMLDKLVEAIPNIGSLNQLLHQAGMNWTASKLVLISAGTGICAFFVVASFARQSFFFSVISGLVMAAVPFLYVLHQRQKRLSQLERQLPEAIDLMVRALRSGHAFSSCLQMVAEQMPEPIAGEFRIVHDEVNFGVSLQQALKSVSERVPITDLRYFVVAVLIQREAGGNLTEVLSNLSRLIRDRLKLFAKVRVLSSEGRFSAWVLVLMPFFIAGALNLLNPGFMSPLWNDPMGIAIVKAMLFCMALGVLVIRKIIKIQV